MKFLPRLRQYLACNYATHSDSVLAHAIGLSEEDVAQLLVRYTLIRSKEDKARIKADGDSTAPHYTGQASLPSTFHSLTRMDALVTLFVFFSVLAVYAPMLSSTVTGEDSGELITAAYTLGVAHPPGYPLWCLLAKLFTFIPFSTVAWRVGFMSVFWAAATVSLVCLLVIKITKSRLGGAAAALAFAFSSEFWGQCVIAEVYGLNEFQIIACLFLMLLWYQHRNDRILYVFAFIYGTGMCNHHTMLLLGPLFVLFVIWVDPLFLKRWRLYLICTLIALSVTTIYLYLPIRSLSNPPMDWGNPEKWDSFWSTVMRRQYKLGVSDKPVSLINYAKQFKAFLSVYAWEFTPWVAWIPFLGIPLLWRKDKYAFYLIGGTAFLTSVVFILLLNFTIDHQSLWLNNAFWIPAYMMGAIGIGLVVARVGEIKTIEPFNIPISLALAVLAIVAPLYANYAKTDKSDYFYSHDMATNILKTLDKDALYFPTADHATFPVIYLQAVEGMRPDVTIANKYGYPEPEVYKGMDFKIKDQVRGIPTKQEEEQIENWVIKNTDRPVYFTKHRIMGGLPDYRLVNAGLTYKILRPGEAAPKRDFWGEYEWHTTDMSKTHGDLTADYILSDVYYGRGRTALDKGDIEGALREFETSLLLGQEIKESLNNIASALAEFGELNHAEEYFLRTLAEDPEYDLALRNLGKVYLQQGRDGEALAKFERILRKDQFDAEALWFSARAMQQIGWLEKAMERYEFLAGVTPDDYRVFHELALLYRDHRHDSEAAKKYFARSKELNPKQEDPQDEPSEDNKPLDPASLLPKIPDPSAILPDMPQMPQMPSADMPGLNVMGEP